MYFFSRTFLKIVYIFSMLLMQPEVLVLLLSGTTYILQPLKLVKFLDGKKQPSIRQYLMAVKMAIFLIIYDNRTK